MAKVIKRGRKALPRERRKALAPRPAAVAPRRSDREYLELAMRAINEGVYDWDIASRKMHYSQGVYSALKVPRNMKTAGDWRKRIHPDDLVAYDAALVAHFKKKTRRFECDYRFRATDGTWRWARQRGIALRDERGRAVRMIGSIGDISELKRAEEARRQSDERYAFAMRAVNEGVYDWNIAEGKTYYSERVVNALGLSPRQLRTAADWHKRVHPEDRPRYDAAMVAHFKGETERFECDYRYRARDGSWRWARQHGIAMRDARGRAVRMIGSTGDINELKLAEIALRRARDEATEALERQTATAEILKVISNSPTDIKPTFDAILESTARLCESSVAALFIFDGEVLSCAAQCNTTPAFAKALRELRAPPSRETSTRLCALERRVVHVDDYLNDPRFKPMSAQAREEARTILSVPLLRGGALVGVITTWRREVRPFSGAQIVLLQTFADQAAIAIENVRLFNETKEALDQQRATAAVMGAISGSISSTQPVFDRILESCERLFAGRMVGINVLDAEGKLQLGAYRGEGRERFERIFPLPPNEGSGSGACILHGRVMHYPDVERDAAVPPVTREGCRALGIKSVIFAPMLSEEGGIGAIFVGRRYAVPFTDKEIELLKSFANQAAIGIKNVRLFNETREALERQTATAQVLKAIANSPADVRPVLDALASRAGQLCRAAYVDVLLENDGKLQTAAVYSGPGGPPPDPAFAMRPLPTTVNGRAFVERRVVHVEDFAAVARTEYPDAVAFQRRFGFRTILGVPMLREGRAIGTISIWRVERNPFGGDEIELVKTFADQAVIAIENVRLFNETKEALERQTATAEVLRVIAGSPADVQPVFQAILRSATRLCSAERGIVFRCDAGVFQGVASQGLSAEATADYLSRQIRPGPLSGLGRMVVARKPVQVADITDDEAYRQGDPLRVRTIKLLGARTAMWLPLLKDGSVVGAFAIYRQEVRPFTEQQVDLVQTFANQAVIAIENVRLFNETKEALEQQTATAGILKVISESPTDTQPVFDAIVESCTRLLACRHSTLRLIKGDRAEIVASNSIQGETADDSPMSLDDDSLPTSRAVTRQEVVQVPDIFAEGVSVRIKQRGEQRGFRSLMIAPLLRENSVMGTIHVHRATPGRFTEKEVALLETFASQAVIAIENVRLFNETKEALEQQTATAAILKVISESPTDTKPVFDAIVQSGLNLFPNAAVAVVLREGNRMRMAAVATRLPAQAEAWRAGFQDPLSRDRMHGIAILDGRLVDVPDAEAEKDGPLGPGVRNFLAGGNRAITIMPMVCDDTAIGAISVIRAAPGPLSEKQIALLRTFAAQAVIAIENVRLFNETKEALEQQTATAEILQVISSSPTDTQPVFEAIVQAGLRLFPDATVLMTIPGGAQVRAVAVAHRDTAVAAATWKRFPIALSRDRLHGAAILEGTLIDFPDVEAETEGRFAPGARNFLASGNRAITIAPMMCGDAAIGAISVARATPGPLGEKQVALLRTFAAQAVIAIENVRVFKELEARTGALSRSVEQLTALGEVGQAISSTLDLETVLKTIVQRAVQLTGLDGGAIYEYDERSEEFHVRAAENLSEDLVQELRETPARKGEGVIGRAVETGQPTEIPEMLDDSYQSPRRDSLIKAGYRALLVVPLLREEHIIGALTVNRKAPGMFSNDVVELLKTFATQSALAIQNARLFREIAEKGRQLEEASRHKSQFLASMSHELRTPLNAILGFNEMILDQVYGEISEDVQAPLQNIQASGRHLLRLINNVLDLAKIEAGRMELSLQDYSVHDAVGSVHSTLQPLAAEKGLQFLASVPEDIPLAYGDGGRIAQCLMNLAGNSIKFTRAGKVEIAVAQKDDLLRYSVADTGIGIPPDKIASLFTEFKQTDATIASEYGGTGLGLSISRKFIEMHGGRIWVESEMGKGSAFIFEIPLRVNS